MYQTLVSLSTEDGINASGKDEIYGCIFGRDSAITILKILRATSSPLASSYFDTGVLHAISKRALLKLVSLQGTTTVFESGEEPGKFIHEYRKDKYDHLLKWEKPWYVYPDGILRNYDSLDSTPLALIAIYKYWKQTGDNNFLLSVLSSVEAGLNWIITYGDLDKDYLVEYQLPEDRKYGGLPVQSWTDSHDSIRRRDGTMPNYPIAPVEVQGYTWLALKLWGDFYSNQNEFTNSSQFGNKLHKYANYMKENFNKLFLLQDHGLTYAAQALDGDKNQLRTITGNPLLLLWAAYHKNSKSESIVESDIINSLVKRAFLPDLFDLEAGIRTMSSLSSTFNNAKDSYHNGSFWPKLNGMSHEGLINFGFEEEANLLKDATLKPIVHFNSPIELYSRTEEGKYIEFIGPDGQTGCKTQAWSAAAALDLLTI